VFDLGWIWISVIVLAVIIEMLTDQLISIWFVPGAMIATVLDFCNVPVIFQILVFLAISIIGIILGKTVLEKYFAKAKNTKTNIDAIIGEKCVVTEKIDNFAGCGQAKVNGQVWSARSVDEDGVFEAGEILVIVAIEGVKLICKKA
jgi:membrane protein implicated in regulation of membrane protease activity